MRILIRLFFIGFFMPFISIPVAAQQDFVSISFGTSIPLGSYRSTGSLNAGGYAGTGGVIKFDAGYFPESYLGFGGTFSFGTNFALRDSLLADMIRYIEENSTTLLNIPDDAEIIYGSGFWNHIDLLIGPHYSIRLSQKLYLDFRILLGPGILRPPDEDLKIRFDDTEVKSIVNNNILILGAIGGAGLRIRLNQAISLKMGTEYYRTRARFPYEFSLFRDVPEKIPPLNAELLIQTLELSAGLAYSF